MQEILRIEDLQVGIDTPQGKVQAVRGVSFTLYEGETLAIVGESGSGKSILCKSILKLLPSQSIIEKGKIWLKGADVSDYTPQQMSALRGKVYSAIFQNAKASLNPTICIGKQIEHAYAHTIPRQKTSKQELYKQSIELLHLVGIADPQRGYELYPHQLSGGMCQRVALAIALTCKPQILFADEPTTALDVTTQAHILHQLKKIQKQQKMAMVLVSHDIATVAGIADRVAILYAGKIVEIGTAEEIYYQPAHPYTWGLMQCLPVFAQKGEPLPTIKGTPANLIQPITGDAFADRNPYALEIDYQQQPPMFRISETHFAATWLLDPRSPKVTNPFTERSKRCNYQF